MKSYTFYVKTNSYPSQIGPFVKYTGVPNAIKYGALYNFEIDTGLPFETKRMARVYLPEDYDGQKSFPVMYMSDVQNAVDKYLTAYGEWDIDEHMHALIKSGHQSFIIAGIDCPKNPYNRMKEYTITKAHIKTRRNVSFETHGEQYADFIINTLKPLVDKYFKTLPDRNHTAFGGSSMGGLCSFDIVSLHPEIFSFALVFSPAFFVLKQREYRDEIKNRPFTINEQKFYFYSGNKDLDIKILPGTIKMYNYLKDIGYDDNHIKLVVDNNMGHSEKAWSKHFINGALYWENENVKER